MSMHTHSVHGREWGGVFSRVMIIVVIEFFCELFGFFTHSKANNAGIWYNDIQCSKVRYTDIRYNDNLEITTIELGISSLYSCSPSKFSLFLRFLKVIQLIRTEIRYNDLYRHSI